MESFLQGMGIFNLGIPGMTFEQALLRLLMAFILGQLTAWIYIYTHSGLSFSKGFVQSLVLLSMIVSLSMMVIGNNVVVAFGLIGALTVIRFRNILKDTRDTAFIFFTLIVGIASGTGRLNLAILGTCVFVLVLLLFHLTSFGSRYLTDGFIRFRIAKEAAGLPDIQTILKKYCRTIKLVSQRLTEEGGGELAFRLAMRDPTRAAELVHTLEESKGVSHVTFVLQEEQSEI